MVALLSVEFRPLQAQWRRKAAPTLTCWLRRFARATMR